MGTAFLMGQSGCDTDHDTIRQEAFDDGYSNGYSNGYDDGCIDGACLAHCIQLLLPQDHELLDGDGGLQITDEVYIPADAFYDLPGADSHHRVGNGEKEAFWSNENGVAYLVTLRPQYNLEDEFSRWVALVRRFDLQTEL